MGSFKQGDIVIAKITFTNLSEFKIRPILILVKRTTNDDFIVLKITSKKRTDEYSFQYIKEILKRVP